MLADLRGSRELLVNLTLREVRGKYKRTVLGQRWSLLNPVATMLIYTLVFGFVLRVPGPTGRPRGLDVFALWLACGAAAVDLLQQRRSPAAWARWSATRT